MQSDERPLDPAEEAALDATLRQLAEARRAGRSDDRLGRLVLSLSRVDRADDGAGERALDAAFAELERRAARVTPFEQFAASLRRSALVRVLVASVVLHALVVPVLAYMAFRPRPEPPYRLTFLVPDRSPAAEERDALQDLDPGLVAAPSYAEAVLRDRAALAAAAVAAAVEPPARLLELFRDAAAGDEVPAATPVERAVVLELLLDDHVLGRGADAHRMLVVRRLAAALAELGTADPLVADALTRARSYGLAPRPAEPGGAAPALDLAEFEARLRASGLAEGERAAAWRRARVAQALDAGR